MRDRTGERHRRPGYWRLIKRVALVILITLALFVAAATALFVYKPSETLLLANVLLAPLFNNLAPPPIAEGQVTHEDWLHWEAASKKLTAVLEQWFPVGSGEAALRSTLLKQGFKAIPPPPASCIPPGQSPPIGVVYRTCLTPDQTERLKRTLKYEWGGGVCAEFVQVEWSADDRGEIIKVNGSYFSACL
jgi:hypothetical protein